MNKYIVRFTYESDATEEVEADHYKTQATNGAGLVADFYATSMAAEPSCTFSHVVSVKKVSKGVFLSVEQSRRLADIVRQTGAGDQDSSLYQLIQLLEAPEGD